MRQSAVSARRALTDAIGRLLDTHQLSRPGEPPSTRRLERIDIIDDGRLELTVADPNGERNDFKLRITWLGSSDP